LALANGKSWSQIQVELQTSRPAIARSKKRFEEFGMAGLDPRHTGSTPRAGTPAVQARVLRKSTQRPEDGSTHWSCCKMAATLGLSKSTVQRIWQRARLKPHRLDRYMASNDAEFKNKAADIIALYRKPPQHTAVFCVDEKSAIQALDRLDPVLAVAGESPG
jgi:transposase